MGLMVGQIQALITADDAQFQATSRKASTTAKRLRSDVESTKGTITADDRGFHSAVGRVDSGMTGLRGRISEFAGDFKGEALAPLARGLAAGGIIAGFQSIVMAASDLNESANAIDQVFGSAARTVFDFTKTASTSIGQSDTVARQAVATFGVYGKQAALSTEENAQFSISLTKLASDMASFKNTSPEQAIEALGAAMRGESDPIEAYGVLLNESILQQRALKMGVISTTSQALTPQQRVMVAYQEILSQTTYMQGDFGRTSGSLANQLRTLQAKVTDTAASVGQALLPAAQSAVSFVSGPMVDALGGLGHLLGGLIGLFGDLPGPIQAAVVAMVAWRLAQDRITAGASGLGERLTAPWRSFAEQVQVHTALAADAGVTNMSRLAAGFSVIETRYPVLGRMAAAYRESASAARTWGQSTAMAGSFLASSTGAVGTFRGALGGLRPAAAGAAAALGVGLRGAASGLMGVLGGPWGVAIMAGASLLSLFMARSQEAAQRQQDLASAGKSVSQALAEQNGAINASTRAAAAKSAEESGLLQQAQGLGIALPRVTSAILGQRGAYSDLRGQLDAIIDRETYYVSRGESTATSLTKTGQAAQQLRDDLGAVVGGRDSDAAAARRQADATKDSAGAMQQGAASAGPMASAIAGLSDQTKSAEDRIKGLADAILGLSGQQLPLDDAIQKANDGIRDLAESFAAAKGQANSSGAAFLNSRNGINTVTEAGSKLHTQLSGLRQAQADVVAATLATADATGRVTPEAAAKAAVSMLHLDGQIRAAARAAGLNAQQVDRMAQHYGFVPRDVVTKIQQPGMLRAIADAIGLRGKILDVPNDKTIVVSSNSAAQVRALETLGFTVRRLPDGRFVITSNAAATENSLVQLDQRIRNLPSKTISITTRYLRSDGGVSVRTGNLTAPQRYGGLLEYYSDGGMRPMSSRVPAIVQSYRRTGTKRVIGDNPVADELFLPLIRSDSRAQALLDIAIQRMRPEMAPQLMLAAGSVLGASAPAMTVGPGKQITVHMHAVPAVPTVQQLRDLLHEIEVLDRGA